MNVVWTALAAVVLAETVLYFAAPSVYALTALVPFGAMRRLVLHPRAAEALRVAPADAAIGYRESAAGRIDLGRLELPERIETDGLVLHFHLGRGFALARLPLSFGKKAYSLLRVDLLATRDTIELRSRFVVMGWPSLVALAPIGAIAVGTTSLAPDLGTFFFGALFVGINIALGMLFAKPRLEAGRGEIHRQIQAALLRAESGS